MPALLYGFQILAPVLAAIVTVRCFHSVKAGRRREEPVILLENTVTKEKIPVLYWENSLGRSRSCDITLRDDTASRDHAVLMRRESGWLVTDTGSKAGTRVNGTKLSAPRGVKPGDVISMGSTSLMLRRTSEAPVKAQKRRVMHAAAPAGLLLCVTALQAMLLFGACFGGGEFSALPVPPFLALLLAEWGLYLYSRRVLNRVSFELETMGFLLSGIGVLLLCGQRAAVPKGAAPPADMLFGLVNLSMKTAYVQIGAMLLGVLLFCVLIWFMSDLSRVMKWRVAIAVLAVLLFVVNLLLAKEHNGARNWISLGGISIQPSEFIKIAFVFVGASTLDRLQTARNLTGFILFGAMCMGALFLMRDFGTACIFFVTFLIIALMRSGSLRTIFLICAAAGLGAFLILQFRPYVAQRFSAWRHVWDFANEGGYQQTRVLTYAASGGLFGAGVGNGALGDGAGGHPVFAANSDLVFGMLWEEAGLALALLVVCAVALLVFYARSDVTRSRSTFYSISACAAAGMMLFQCCLNMFGATDILPLTGVTLPFVSAGGSSMVACWGLLAFIKASDERTYAARRQSK